MTLSTHQHLSNKAQIRRRADRLFTDKQPKSLLRYQGPKAIPKAEAISYQ
jgi:hypothetical protein